MNSINDFVIENGVLKKYNGSGGDVVIPDGVTSIGNSAFAWQGDITSITIPKGVTKIGKEAFCVCMNLLNIIIPDSVRTIGDGAFTSCTRLTNITLPTSLKRLSKGLFTGCKSLISITIPEGVTKICDSTFLRCENLTSVIFPESVSEFGKEVFSSCGKLEEITVGDISILPKEYKAFAVVGFSKNSNFRSESSIQSHKKYIKANAIKLVDVAMRHTALLSLMCQEKLITPANVELFVQKAQESENIEAISLMLDYWERKITKVQKATFENKKKEAETEIFERASARIGKNGIEGLTFVIGSGFETFKSKNELKDTIVKNGGAVVANISSKVDYLISNDTGVSSDKNKKATDLGIDIITEYQFNEKINRIFEVDENGILLKYMGNGGDVVIPDDKTEIGDYAFFKCKSLTNIAIPERVTKIGALAFFGCKGLKDKNGFVVVRNVLYGYYGSESLVVIPNGITKIEGAFAYCEIITDVVIPESVIKIGDSTFKDCKGLRSVVIPEGVTELGENAFSMCYNLTHIVIPDSLTTIKGWAFYSCTNLENIVIPKEVSVLDDNIFCNCKNLASIVIPDNVTKISKDAFSFCENLVIHASKGSYAETYAKENNIAFVSE